MRYPAAAITVLLVVAAIHPGAYSRESVVPVEAYLQYNMKANAYDPKRDDIQRNLAKANSMMDLFDPNGGMYAKELVWISRLQRWRGNIKTSKDAERTAWSIFERNFYPKASGAGEILAFVYLLDQGAPNSRSCARAHELFDFLFRRDPGDPAIYASMPLCILGETKRDAVMNRRLNEMGKWFDAGARLFSDMKLEEVKDPDVLWLDIEFSRSRIIYEDAGRGTDGAEHGTAEGYYRENVAAVQAMRRIAERIYALSPKNPSSNGLLGSLLVGETLYQSYLPENLHRKKDEALLDRAIKLLSKAMKKGDFPSAYEDASLAYLLKNDFAKAYSVAKAGVERYPCDRDLAESVVAAVAMREPVVPVGDFEKLSLEAARTLSKRLEKTEEYNPRDFLLTARLYDIADRRADAARYVDEGLKIFPNDSGLNRARQSLSQKRRGE